MNTLELPVLDLLCQMLLTESALYGEKNKQWKTNKQIKPFKSSVKTKQCIQCCLNRTKTTKELEGTKEGSRNKVERICWIWGSLTLPCSFHLLISELLFPQQYPSFVSEKLSTPLSTADSPLLHDWEVTYLQIRRPVNCKLAIAGEAVMVSLLLV